MQYQESIVFIHNLNFMKHYETTHHGKLFKVEEDYPEIGAYLYVYENGRCEYDYLQNSIKDCMEFAVEQFGVPINSWNELINELTNK